jgi:ABC-type phosphate transport system substrate-binding protein
MWLNSLTIHFAKLNGGPIGVIAFAPVVNKDADASITNITIQQLRRLVSNGTIPTSMLTGNASSNGTIDNVGRNDGSGTRVVLLSETGLGAKSFVVNHYLTGNTTLDTPIQAPTTVDTATYPSTGAERTQHNSQSWQQWIHLRWRHCWLDEKGFFGNFNIVSWPLNR